MRRWPQLEKERGIPQDYMLEKITQALIAAYKKDKEGYTDNVFVEIKDDDPCTCTCRRRSWTTSSRPPRRSRSTRPARSTSTPSWATSVNVDVETQDFGRIAAQTAKQVIIQGIREAERGMVFDTFSSKEHEILSGTVLRASTPHRRS